MRRATTWAFAPRTTRAPTTGGGRRRRQARATTAAGPIAASPAHGRQTVWVLVADEAIARILHWPERRRPRDVEALTDPAAHAKEGDFHARRRRPARRVAPHGSRQNSPHRLRGTASVTASAGEDEQHLEAQAFARRVAQHLAEALRQKRFDELRIVAAPRFLGHLRKELDGAVSATVAAELSKDLIHETTAS